VRLDLARSVRENVVAITAQFPFLDRDDAPIQLIAGMCGMCFLCACVCMWGARDLVVVTGPLTPEAAAERFQLPPGYPMLEVRARRACVCV
jgi:hypothetical protein